MELDHGGEQNWECRQKLEREEHGAREKQEGRGKIHAWVSVGAEMQGRCASSVVDGCLGLPAGWGRGLEFNQL